ncbi:MAG: glycosyltransferase [Eubacterium sp.]|nr:glycosyltransferase [Eubacterium sp.]
MSFFLMGAVDNPYPYFAGCDLYVHISRYEGRSVAIQEAQALGCAVLASDCSGNREQIQDGVDGILEKLDVGRLTNRIEGLLKDERQRQFLCEQARNKPVEHPEDIRKLLSFAE